MLSLFLSDIQAAEKLLNFGVLGIFSVIMLSTIAVLGRHFLILHNRNESRIKELENTITIQFVKDREILFKTISDCCNIMQDCKTAIENQNKIIENANSK